MEKKQRESGIELLKIIAIILIAITHVTMTLGKQEYTGGYRTASTDIQHFMMSLFYYVGVLGNGIFFIASAWFLTSSKRVKKDKLFQMLMDVWIVSLLFLAIFLLAGTNIKTADIIYSLFPTTFSNNWYATDYMIFYLIHPYLNLVIDKMEQKEHLIANGIATFLYCMLNMIRHDLMESTGLVTFIVIYFVVAYVKKYRMERADNTRLNRIGFAIGFFGLLLLLFLTNVIGLKNDFIGQQMLHWAKNSNPLIILMAFALFNLFRNMHFKNRVINFIGSITLIIYITHENLLVREYLRPVIWSSLYERYGMDHLVLQVLAFAAVLFLTAVFVSTLYKITIQRFTGRLASEFSGCLDKRIGSNAR